MILSANIQVVKMPRQRPYSSAHIFNLSDISQKISNFPSILVFNRRVKIWNPREEKVSDRENILLSRCQVNIPFVINATF